MIYTKQYLSKELNKKRHFGLSYRESFDLELESLKRVKGYPHMCQLVSYDTDTLTLHLDWAGQNFNHYIDQIQNYRKQKKRSKKQNLLEPVLPDLNDFVLTRLEFNQQIETVFEIFEDLNIVHFDLGPWNICVKDHQITIIDFGCVVLDGNIKSQCLDDPYRKFLLNGGYTSQKEHTLSRINSKLYTQDL
jgi:hypothetical protein